jgi:hypothetical protein
MKSIWAFASLTAITAAWAFTGCSSKDDDQPADDSNAGTSGKGDEPNAGGSDGTGVGGSGGATSPGGGENTTTGGASEAGQGGVGGGGTGTATALSSCSSGTLFEGDPLFDGDTEDIGTSVEGQGLFDDPPLRNEALAFVGSRVFIETETEIWASDLSANTPTLTRIAGVEAEGDQAFLEAGKPCADTHFLVMRGMIAKPNGKLAVVDYVGGAVLEISDPGGANCKSEYVAGTHVKSVDPGPDYPVLPGDVDGPGKDALFGSADNHGGVFRLTSDPDNNLFVYDNGNNKFKMIANEDDADRSVSTVGVGNDGDTLTGLTYLKGKLYAVGVDGTNDVLLEIDPAQYDAADPTANVKELFRERNHFEEIESSHQAVITQVISDGEALIITGNSGYIWRVATDGKVLATLAGTGIHLGYDGGFDPTVSHPADEWQLAFGVSNSAIGGPWLAQNGSELYWSGGYGIGKHIVGFDCK